MQRYRRMRWLTSIDAWDWGYDMLDTKRNALLDQVATLVEARSRLHQVAPGVYDPERNARLKQIERELANLWEAIRRMPQVSDSRESASTRTGEVRNGRD